MYTVGDIRAGGEGVQQAVFSSDFLSGKNLKFEQGEVPHFFGVSEVTKMSYSKSSKS